jgi:predicted nucleic acid-binding Zn ribbon protein
VPKYNFKCDACEAVISKNMSMLQLKDATIMCASCDDEMKQVVGSFSSSVSMSKEERLEKTKEDARKIADKVRSGDQKLISQIYGEK